ncbi:MAG: hypothetical protein ACHQ15_00275 [Candidatus Limnocylindrales bacterium]
MTDLQHGLEQLFHGLIDLLTKVLLPDWNDLVTNLLPIATFLLVTGPILTLVLLYWAYQMAKRPRFRVRSTEPAPMAVPRDDAGSPLVPANVPYCSRDELVYPPRATRCAVCGDELSVRCAVDETLRPVSQQTCRACGTRYVLGASETALAVRRTGRPPEGGAAVA